MRYPRLKCIDRDLELNIAPIESRDLLLIPGDCGAIKLNDTVAITSRIDGDFANNGFWLQPYYDWVVGIDRAGVLVLVPFVRR